MSRCPLVADDRHASSGGTGPQAACRPFHIPVVRSLQLYRCVHFRCEHPDKYNFFDISSYSMRKFLKILAAFSIIGTLAGCAVGTTAVLKGDSATPSPDEAVVVLGIKSPGFRVMLFPVSVKEGRFSVGPFDNAVVNGSSTDGYLVAKVMGGQMLGLTRIVAPDADAILGGIFSTCGDNRGLVFEAPGAGQVVYLTDVEYVRNGRRLEVRYTSEMERAQNYMEQRFSSIAGKLKKHEFQLIKGEGSCDFTIPIYIGR
jgi:hypothetical protein